MAVLVADFLVRFPAFEGTPPSSVEAQLSDAGAILDPASFTNPTIYSRAVMLLAAHNLTLSGHGETAEATIVSQGFALDTVQSVSDGGLSVSLASKEGVGPFAGTSYGRELTQIMRAGRGRFATVGGRYLGW